MSESDNKPENGELHSVGKSQPFPMAVPRPKGWFVFWLLAPAAASLCYLSIYKLVGQVPGVFAVGMCTSIFLSAGGAIYCAAWIVKWIIPNDSVVIRILAGLVLAGSIFVVNFLISIIGCLAHMPFRLTD